MSGETEQTAGQELRVRAATLWLRVDLRASHRSRGRIPSVCVPTLWVFAVKPEVDDSIDRIIVQDFSEMTVFSASHVINLSELGWQKVDLTSTIHHWYSGPRSEKLRLLIDCSGCCKHFEVHMFSKSETRMDDPNRPFIVVHTDPNTTKRVRRRALDCRGASHNQCCKQEFYVSFKELGWDDWVIAPSGYHANYCRGNCGFHRTPDTFLNYYTHVIEEVRKTNQLNDMQPCCAPLKFSSMSLIYFGPDANIIKRDLPKMIVEECGCP